MSKSALASGSRTSEDNKPQVSSILSQLEVLWAFFFLLITHAHAVCNLYTLSLTHTPR
eukprot:m.14041 g.14041  ORF g.14041 m.14041 type:complete len:58 (-) comp8732_c0_seq1:86-259(-)